MSGSAFRVLTPCDYFFARNGIAAEGNVNQVQMVITDVDLNLLEEQRIKGTVLPLNDLIRDAYDRVIHFADHRSEEERIPMPGANGFTASAIHVKKQ
jgi:hypothetical protein